jgi:hypothetical protein
MQIKLFTRKACSKCPPAKEICQKFSERGLIVLFLDVDTSKGREEAVRHGVMALPTTILVDERGSEMMSWRGQSPDENVLEALAGGK